MSEQKNTSWVEFRTVKQQVSMQQALNYYGVKLRSVTRTSLRGNCPLPTHTGKSKNSFAVNLQKNVWVCHSQSCVQNRQGQKGGDVLDFVAAMENCSLHEAALKLQEWFLFSSEPVHEPATVPVASVEVEAEREFEEEEPNPPLRFTLKVDHVHPYLAERGISPETAQYFGVGFCQSGGSMRGRVVIPTHNCAGELVAYAGRSLDGAQPKYKLPRGFRKSLELFNYHRAVGTKQNEVNEVIVVEGYFDAMKVHQAGFPNVVALMGSSLSEAQQDLLALGFERAVLMLDGDEAGRAASREIAWTLAKRLYVRVIELPEGQQPDQLSAEEVRAFLEKGQKYNREPKGDQRYASLRTGE